MEINICPICGFDKLLNPPYDNLGYPSYEICPCCSFEYGFDDSSEGFTFDSFRKKWIENGFTFSIKEEMPKNWDKDAMLKQLDNIKKVNFKLR
jgi:hypothetical protein